ncbi:MAG: hypothetical protein JSR59_15090 [Proteobacteria bacterium]|nr:hypothetical protein [Pseudomonadota bacterium]
MRRRDRALAGLVVLLASGGCRALSSMGDVEVTQTADGLPCFAVRGDAPLRLHALSVTHGERRDWRTLPDESWGYTVAPPGAALAAGPTGCIRYGEAPPAATVRHAPEPLRPARLYRVEISASPPSGSDGTAAYEAEFCLVDGADGKPAVRAVAWDAEARRWRREVCPDR